MQLAADPYPTPGRPGGPGAPGWYEMHSAVYSATPSKLTDGHENVLTQIALERGLTPYSAADRIRATYNATPSKFSATDEAIVEGAALLRQNGSDVNDVIRAVYDRTPSGFTGAQEAAVEAVALLSNLNASQAGAITANVWNAVPSSMPRDQIASAMMGAFISAAGNSPWINWQFQRLASDMQRFA